ncbi:MAG: beta-phosphoglucomutase, partial [Spirochaetales bacterium]|nr:beta-phosphoglucomutase [Spirochaetales bacterium]
RTEHVLLQGTPLEAGFTEEGDKLINRIGVSADQGEEILLVKYCAYASSREPGEKDPLAVVRAETARAVSTGTETLLREHREYLARFWERSDIRIEGDEVLQQGLRFNLLALLQSAGRDGIRSIAAKGLSGEGYEGHYFWDTEIYVLPFFIHTFPDIARALLLYRYSILDKARERAAVLSEQGALFPWRTIAGDEASAYFPAGTAQYHINADIVYGLEKYYRATGDTAFLGDYGAEIAFETARLWMSLGDFVESRGGKFCLNCVTGPDEYTALVNNNLYTNIMARGNLEFALKAAEYLKKEAPERWELLKKRLSLAEEELKSWRAAIDNMYLPYDSERGIHPQDDSFLDKEIWDFQNTPPENYPLLLHYHPLVIYRHQVLKQPDVVLAMFLQGRHFSRADKRRNFLYYDPLTTGDSSLGPCIRSVAAAEQGDTSLAYTYFMTTARMDLDDVNGNVKDGVHTAAMAGTWISIVYGFGGMRKKDDQLFFDPKLPKAWKALEFRVRYKANELAVFLTEKEVRYSLLEGEGVTFYHQYTPVTLSSGASRTLSLMPRLEGILFDLDGVVTDTAELHYRAWKRLTEELGIPFDRRVNEELKGIGRRESFKIILHHAGISMTEGEIALRIEVKNGYYGELLREMTPKDILPGVMEFLKDLKSRKIKTALISASRNAPFIVDRLGLREFFDATVSPDEVVIGKPDPEICFVAAEKLRLPLKHCAGIEDAAAGIGAIRSAGMFSVGIGPAAAGADLSLAGTKELTFEALEKAFLKRWGWNPA